MRKFLFLFIGFTILYTDPYKPKPILFIHGYTGSSLAYGIAPDDERSDSLYLENLEPNTTFDKFLNKINPYCIVWDSLDPSYTSPTNPQDSLAYPNKSFLEVINFDYPVGTIDEGYAVDWTILLNPSFFVSPIIEALTDRFVKKMPMPRVGEYQPGWGYELRQRIKEVLKEYYGENWENDTSAKVILIAHSAGNLAIRWAITEELELAYHIKRIISTGGTHNGSPFMDIGLGDVFVYGCSFWIPTIEFLGFKGIKNEQYLLLFKNFIEPFLGNAGADAVFNLALGVVFSRYSDIGRDLGTRATSSFQRRINSPHNLEKQLNTEYRLIYNRAGIFSHPRYGALNKFFAVPATALQVALYISQLNFVMAGLKAGSLAEWLLWCETSDMAVPIKSQRWAESYVYDYTYKLMRKGFYGVSHDDETKRYQDIIKVFEQRPFIDSVCLIQTLESGSTKVNYLSEDKIDTIITSFENLRIEGKLKNTYFLAQSAPKIWINLVHFVHLVHLVNCVYRVYLVCEKKRQEIRI